MIKKASPCQFTNMLDFRSIWTIWNNSLKDWKCGCRRQRTTNWKVRFENHRLTGNQRTVTLSHPPASPASIKVTTEVQHPTLGMNILLSKSIPSYQKPTTTITQSCFLVCIQLYFSYLHSAPTVFRLEVTSLYLITHKHVLTGRGGQNYANSWGKNHQHLHITKKG